MAVTINASTSNGLQLSSDTSGEIQLQYDGTTNLTIKPTGNVLIGRTADSTVGLGVKLDVAGGVNAAGILTTTTGNVLVGRTVDSTVGNTVKVDVFGGINAASYLINGTALPTAAAQADQETSTSSTTYITPAVQQFHPSAAKVWGNFLANSTTINQSYKVSSLADTATGQMTVNFGVTFSATTYAVLVGIEQSSTTLVYSTTHLTRQTTSVIINSVVEAGSGADPTTWAIAIFGDL